jgi:pyruvate kinase
MSIDCIATLGPTSFDMIGRLVEAGATAFRLNTAHMTGEATETLIARVRATAGETPVYLDLQGAKTRLGVFAERAVSADEEVVFSLGASPTGAIPAPHPELFAQARPGDTLRVDDDKLRFRVTESAADRIMARSERAGVLRPRKGVNLLDHPVELGDLSDFDQRMVRLAAGQPAVLCAVSFVRDGLESDWVRKRLPGRPVVGKIERAEAAAAAQTLASRFDKLWICRGDLGAQLGLAAMAGWVSRFEPAAVGAPVLMAGQVLEHLTSHSAPTRSEVCHLYDLVRRGYAGMVLSDETAIGQDPERAVRITAQLLREFLS